MPFRVFSMNFSRRLLNSSGCRFLICIVSILTRLYKSGSRMKLFHHDRIRLQRRQNIPVDYESVVRHVGQYGPSGIRHQAEPFHSAAPLLVQFRPVAFRLAGAQFLHRNIFGYLFDGTVYPPESTRLPPPHRHTKRCHHSWVCHASRPPSTLFLSCGPEATTCTAQTLI